MDSPKEGSGAVKDDKPAIGFEGREGRRLPAVGPDRQLVGPSGINRTAPGVSLGNGWPGGIGFGTGVWGLWEPAPLGPFWTHGGLSDRWAELITSISPPNGAPRASVRRGMT